MTRIKTYSLNMTTILNSRRKRRIPPRAFLYAIGLCALFGAAFLARDTLAGALWQALTPLFVAREQGIALSGGLLGQFTSATALAEENKRLQDTLAALSSRLIDRDFLYQENIELKWRLGRTIAEHITLAAVILRPPGIPYDTLMIDAGAESGIRKGDLVSAGGSAFIGYVAEAYPSSSRVVLFSSPGEVREALLRGDIPISLEGQGAGSLVGELPAGTDVFVGDPVLIPSIMPQFMAEVTAVARREGESFQSIYLELPANPFTLRFVEVYSIP